MAISLAAGDSLEVTYTVTASRASSFNLSEFRERMQELMQEMVNFNGVGGLFSGTDARPHEDPKPKSDPIVLRVRRIKD